MTLSGKQKLNLTVGLVFTLILAVTANLSLDRLGDISKKFAAEAKDQAELSHSKILAVEVSLLEAMESQKTSLSQQRRVETMIQTLEESVVRLSQEFKTASSALEETSRKIKIVGLNSNRVNSVIKDSVENLSYAIEELPENDFRFELEDIHDELFDQQDLLQKEVILSLEESTRSVDDFSKQLGLAGQAVAELAVAAHEQIDIVRQTSQSSEQTVAVAQNALSLMGSTVELQAEVKAKSDATSQMLHREAKTSGNILLWVSVLAISILIVFATYIAISTLKQLRGVIARLKQSKEETQSSANDLSEISFALGSGATELASVSEETAAAVDEITSMSKLNSDRASDAKTNARHAKDAVGLMAKRMKVLSDSIEEIESSSDEVGAILASIEEVAFQTNLLALNAAVEAARAGEAGAGFAVVADEVRALAIRSSEAAKKTGIVIEKTRNLTVEGVSHCREVNEHLKGVRSKMDNMNDEFAAITGASEEQVIGLDQLGSAIREMESLSSCLGRDSEKTSDASQDLKVQLSNLQVQITSLSRMVEKGDQNTDTKLKLQSDQVKLPAERRLHQNDAASELTVTKMFN